MYVGLGLGSRVGRAVGLGKGTCEGARVGHMAMSGADMVMEVTSTAQPPHAADHCDPTAALVAAAAKVSARSAYQACPLAYPSSPMDAYTSKVTWPKVDGGLGAVVKTKWRRTPEAEASAPARYDAIPSLALDSVRPAAAVPVPRKMNTVTFTVVCVVGKVVGSGVGSGVGAWLWVGSYVGSGVGWDIGSGVTGVGCKLEGIGEGDWLVVGTGLAVGLGDGASSQAEEDEIPAVHFPPEHCVQLLAAEAEYFPEGQLKYVSEKLGQ